MKKILYTSAAAILVGLSMFNLFVPRGIAAESGETVVVPRQYVALARMLADSRDDSEKAKEIAGKAVASVVGKGDTYEEKLQLLAEITTALTAAVEDWTEEARAAVISAIVEQALKLAPDGDEGDLQQIGFVRQVFAAIMSASVDSVALVSALDVVPEHLRETATSAIGSAMTVLGGKTAWRCKDLYEAVRKALGDETPSQMLRDQVIVTVSTTTSTTTSTSTTTTTIPGSPGISVFDGPTVTPEPTPVPTTRPSPTPVGLR